MVVLKGHTLGQKQKYYNQLVKEVIATRETSDIPKINFDEDDIDNIVKIDLACHDRNIPYILEVFKCEDMLYVSRAINKSTWLITDPQYAHIVNPKYLHTELFPHMHVKAITKLMLCIRRFLSDEKRVKAFFHYVFNRNSKAAMHWLQNCPMNFIEHIVALHADKIPIHLIVRLCRKSFNILRIFARSQKQCYDICKIYERLKYYLKRPNNAEELLRMDDTYNYDSCIPLYFNAKYTRVLMEVCPQQLIDHFIKYYNRIHLPTFVNSMKSDEIKSFIMKHQRYNFVILRPFLLKISREEMLDFLQTVFEINSADIQNSKHCMKSIAEATFYAIEGNECNALEKIYRWYEFVPFDIAFSDIKRLIYAESSSADRHSILITLLSCARNNFQDVKTVLQYYHDKHINEPYVHKITFVNSLLTQHDAFRFDDSTWNLLNDIFHSLEVYIDSNNEVQNCIKVIIVHDLLHNNPIHEMVEEKVKLDTFKDIKNKLNHNEQNKLFDYVYNLFKTKLMEQNTNTETGMHEAIQILISICNLLKHWNKVENDHNIRSFIVDKIIELGNIYKASCWTTDFVNYYRRKHRKRRRNRKIYREIEYQSTRAPPSEHYLNIPSIYNIIKSYRKELFQSSLILHPSKEVCLNALKHDPGLLTRHKKEVDIIRCNNEISLKVFLNKLRTYWPLSLATIWAETNIKYLDKIQSHRALVRGVLLILPRSKLLKFIEIYEPNDSKILWCDDNNQTKLSIQKHIAKNMHIVRPHLPVDVVFRYANGDYLQYAILSINTTFTNIRPNDISEYIYNLLNSPAVLLQKHGIRLAFQNFQSKELVSISSTLWNKTKNSYIRAVLFRSLFDLLCKLKAYTSISRVWDILNSFIGDLNHKENRIIYNTLGKKVRYVPSIIIGECYQKAYIYLDELPPHIDLNDNTNRIFGYALQLIEYLDPEFVENTLFYSIHSLLSDRNDYYLDLLASYLLCSKDWKTQVRRYNKLLRPVVKASTWHEGEGKDILSGLQQLLTKICHNIPLYVVEKKRLMPLHIVESIRIILFQDLSNSVLEYYILLTRWELAAAYIEDIFFIIKEAEHPFKTWACIVAESTKALAEICVDSLTNDAESWFPSVYLLFTEALQQIFTDFKLKNEDIINVLEHMLEYGKSEPVYLLVLNMLPNIHGFGINDKKRALRREILSFPSLEVAIHCDDSYSENESAVDSDDNDDSLKISIENIPILTENETLKSNKYGYYNICNIL